MSSDESLRQIDTEAADRFPVPKCKKQPSYSLIYILRRISRLCQLHLPVEARRPIKISTPAGSLTPSAP